MSDLEKEIEYRMSNSNLKLNLNKPNTAYCIQYKNLKV